jgi:ankyrin repeat protein
MRLALLFLPTLLAQTPKVDFARDIQPLFQKHCISCHGPDQQSRGLRLDQRSSAMEGRGSVRLGPGNAAASMVYLRTAGTKYGPQMPLGGAPLKPAEIELIRTWIDQGADWPDALSGDKPLPPPDPRALALIAPLQSGDTKTFQNALKKDPEAIHRKGPGGATPLHFAALHGNREAAAQLLAQSANPNAANDAGATPLHWALDDLEITRLLLANKANPTAKTLEGRTPAAIAAADRRAPALELLLAAGAKPTPAGASHEAVLKLLLKNGHDPKSLAPNLPAAIDANTCQPCIDTLLPAAPKPVLNNALLAAIRQGNPAHAKLLLDRGADPNTAEPSLQTTALMIAASLEIPNPAIVKTLLEKGARPTPKTTLGATVTDFAHRQGHTEVVRLLQAAGAPPPQPAPTPTGRIQPASNSRAALSRTLPLLQKNDVAFLRKAGCVSCHNNNLTAMVVAEARQQKWPVDEQTARSQRTAIEAFIEVWRERYLQGLAIPGGTDTTAYILLGLAAESAPPTPATHAMARYLKNKQYEDGSWPAAPGRAPLESSAIQGTATALRAVMVYKPKTQTAEYDASIQRAVKWLKNAKPVTTEDYTFLILGLLWAGDQPAAKRAANALLQQQRPDGGWAQTPTLPSDAYATGQALFAARKAGAIKPAQPSYQRGAEYLRNTQYEDGSWYVRSRTTVPFQPFFESGFPHGRDQYISVAATNWAALALLPLAGK